MKKLERIENQAQKARERIAALQSLLKEIDGKRTEQENLQLVKRIRALNLSRDELYAFMSGGELPPALAAAFSGTTAEPETVYSRKDKKRKNKQGGVDNADPDDTGDTTTPETENPYGDTDTPNYESEGN